MTNQKNSIKEKKQYFHNYAKYSGIAFQMLAIILLGVWIGIYLDKYLKLQNSVFTILFTIVSIILSMLYIIKQVSKK